MHFKSRFIGLNTHQPKPRTNSGRPVPGRKDSPVIPSLHHCHPERSEGSRCPFTPVLCCSEAWTVILSAAKDLAAHRAVPSLKVTIGGNSQTHTSIKLQSNPSTTTS